MLCIYFKWSNCQKQYKWVDKNTSLKEIVFTSENQFIEYYRNYLRILFILFLKLYVLHFPQDTGHMDLMHSLEQTLVSDLSNSWQTAGADSEQKGSLFSRRPINRTEVAREKKSNSTSTVIYILNTSFRQPNNYWFFPFLISFAWK